MHDHYNYNACTRSLDRTAPVPMVYRYTMANTFDNFVPVCYAHTCICYLDKEKEIYL